MNIRKCLLIALAILLAMPTVGCTNGFGLEKTVAKAYNATAKVKSCRVKGIYTYPSRTSEMEFVAPDRIHHKTTENDYWHEAVQIGTVLYFRDSNSEIWQATPMPPIYQPQGLRYLDSLVKLKKLSGEAVDGADCFHYTAELDMNAVLQKQQAQLQAEMAMLEPKGPSYHDHEYYEQQKKGLEKYYEQRKTSFESLGGTEVTIELWISRQDYLIRQVKEETKVAMPEAKEEKEKWVTTKTLQFYDFNQPIKIEAVQLSDYANFSSDIESTVGGEEPKHQQISYHISITNIGTEQANNVWVFVFSPATNEGLGMIEAEPPSKSRVNLNPGEGETYNASWEYDLSKSSKRELSKLLEQTSIWAMWVTPEDEERRQLLFPQPIL